MVEPYLTEAPFEEFCSDIVMGSDASSIGHTNLICTEPIDSMPISSLLLSTTSSHLHAFHEFLGDIRGSYPSFDPYCANLEDMLGKTMLSPFFYHTFDFSMTFDDSKRSLTLFA